MNETVLQDPGWYYLDQHNQAPFVSNVTAVAPGSGAADWLQKNSTAVFVIAAALFALALLGGRHR